MTEKKPKTIDINRIYIGILIAITIVFIIVVLWIVIRPFDYRNITQIPQIEANEILNCEIDKSGNQRSYLVFIYDKDNIETTVVKDKIIEYANYAKGHKTSMPIYVIEYNETTSKSINSVMPETFVTSRDFPCVILVSDQAISQSKITTTNILTYLDSLMTE